MLPYYGSETHITPYYRRDPYIPSYYGDSLTLFSITGFSLALALGYGGKLTYKAVYSNSVELVKP